MRAYRAEGLAAVDVIVGVLVVTLGATMASAQAPRTVREFGAPVNPMFEGGTGTRMGPPRSWSAFSIRI